MDMRAAEESGRNMSLKWRENKRESPHGQVLLIMVTVLCFVAAGCPPRKPVLLATGLSQLTQMSSGKTTVQTGSAK